MPSLEDVPTWFSDYFDISLEAGQIILSLIVILAVLLPVLIVTRGRTLIIPLAIFFVVEVLLVGIGWLNVWVVIVTVCIVALLWAKETSALVTGG